MHKLSKKQNMKKLILSLIIALCVNISFAQDTHFGARGAINLGTIWGDLNDAPWGFGFNAGFCVKASSGDLVNIVPEVSFNMHRASDDKATWKTFAIDVPILLRFNVAPQFFFDAGPSFNIILSSEAEEKNDATTQTTDYSEFDMLNTFEMAIVAGFGYSVMPNLDINFRFAMGITDIIDTKRLAFYSDYKKNPKYYSRNYGFSDPEDIYSLIEDHFTEQSNSHLQFQFGVTFWFN